MKLSQILKASLENYNANGIGVQKSEFFCHSVIYWGCKEFGLNFADAQHHHLVRSATEFIEDRLDAACSGFTTTLHRYLEIMNPEYNELRDSGHSFRDSTMFEIRKAFWLDLIEELKSQDK